MRRTLALVAWLLATVAVAVPSEVDELAAERRAAPVTLDGRVLFEVIAPEGSSVTAEQRAQVIGERLVAAARDKAAVMVRAVPEEESATLFLGTHLIMLVLPADATRLGLTVDRVTEILAPIVEEAVSRYRADRSAGRLLRSVGGTAAVVLAAGLVLFLY